MYKLKKNNSQLSEWWLFSVTPFPKLIWIGRSRKQIGKRRKKKTVRRKFKFHSLFDQKATCLVIFKLYNFKQRSHLAGTHMEGPPEVWNISNIFSINCSRMGMTTSGYRSGFSTSANTETGFYFVWNMRLCVCACAQCLCCKGRQCLFQ